MRRIALWLGRGFQIKLALMILVWTWFAVSSHAAGVAGVALHAVVLLLALGTGLAIWRKAWGALWAGMAGTAALAGLWWLQLEPRGDRVWAADVQHGVTAEISGPRVILKNVRNFRWQTPEAATEIWETRQVDLNRLQSVDMLTSVWGSPLIAHTLVSFGFDDGQRIVFSGEIRKEEGEAYSAIAGFFRRYELVMIAADERDIVHLRTDVRGERVSLFPVTLAPETRQALFLAFVARANALNARPEWYHTVVANCTTVPYQLVKALAPDVPLDWRVLVSGLLPGFLHDLGVLRPDLTLDQVLSRAALMPSGQNAPEGAEYSALLRRGWDAAAGAAAPKSN